MAEYRLIDGRVVSDSQLEEIAREFESGSWEGRLTDVALAGPKPSAGEESRQRNQQ